MKTLMITAALITLATGAVASDMCDAIVAFAAATVNGRDLGVSKQTVLAVISQHQPGENESAVAIRLVTSSTVEMIYNNPEFGADVIGGIVKDTCLKIDW